MLTVGELWPCYRNLSWSNFAISRERNGSRAARTCQEWKRSGTGSRMDHPLTVGGISANCWGIDFPQNDAEN